MALDTSLLAAFFVAALAVCVTPGPDMLYILSFGVAKGRAGGVAAAGGVALGMLFHTVLATFGVSALVAHVPVALRVLKYLGMAYLCYMGLDLVRDRSSLSISEEKPSWSVRRIVAKAALVNMSNPKVLVFYIAFLPQFTSAHVGPVYQQMLLLGVTFVVMGFLTDATVGVLSGNLGERLAASPTGVRRLNVACGAVMFVLAAIILFAG
jgi:threonine/homoserine/homoserine lactone efflux protein